MNIYVSNLPKNINNNTLRGLFGKYGTVDLITIVIDNKTQLNKGYGFVYMHNKCEAMNAIKALNGSTICDKEIKVEISNGEYEKKQEKNVTEKQKRLAKKRERKERKKEEKQKKLSKAMNINARINEEAKSYTTNLNSALKTFGKGFSKGKKSKVDNSNQPRQLTTKSSVWNI